MWAMVSVLLLGNRSLSVYGTTLPVLVGGYLAGGMASGAVVGALVPIANSIPGAALVGTIGAAPFAFAMRVVLRGLAPWEGVDTFLIVVFSILVGGGFAGDQWKFQRMQATRSKL